MRQTHCHSSRSHHNIRGANWFLCFFYTSSKTQVAFKPATVIFVGFEWNNLRGDSVNRCAKCFAGGSVTSCFSFLHFVDMTPQQLYSYMFGGLLVRWADFATHFCFSRPASCRFSGFCSASLSLSQSGFGLLPNVFWPGLVRSIFCCCNSLSLSVLLSLKPFVSQSFSLVFPPLRYSSPTHP